MNRGVLGYVFFDAACKLFFVQLGHTARVFPFDIGVV